MAAAGTVVKPTCHLNHARSAGAGRDLFFDIEELTTLDIEELTTLDRATARPEV
jgi:hypothetical protein